MFKKSYLILTALLLSLIMVFCSACKKSDDNTDSTPKEQNTPNFPEIETYDYLEGEVMDLVEWPETDSLGPDGSLDLWEEFAVLF